MSGSRREKPHDSVAELSTRPAALLCRGYAGIEMLAAYEGLPDGAETHWDMLTVFKRAAQPLGIRAHLVTLLETLFMFSRSEDWEPDQEPIVWPSNVWLAETLGIEERQVTNRIKCLIDSHLVVAKDSPNGSRRGTRNNEGRIIEAHGFSLALLAVRFREFQQVAEEAARLRRAKQVMRKRITIARRRIRQVAQAGWEYEVPGYDWEAFAAEAGGKRPSEIGEFDVLNSLAHKLEELAEKAEKHFNETVNITPQGDGICQHNTGTTELNTDSGTRPSAQKSRAVGRDRSQLETSVTVKQVLAAAPSLLEYTLAETAGPRPYWSDAAKAAASLTRKIGVSPLAWTQACQSMGSVKATIALAITSAHHDMHELHSPGGYFVGIMRKWQNGEANLVHRRIQKIQPGGRRNTQAPLSLASTRLKNVNLLNAPVH